MSLATVIFMVLCASLVAAEWNVQEFSSAHTSCDLPRVHMNDLLTTDTETDSSKQSLLERLHSFDTPVVIEGAISNWIALEKWSNQSYFLEKFGDFILPRNVVTKAVLDIAQGSCNFPLHCCPSNVNYF